MTYFKDIQNEIFPPGLCKTLVELKTSPSDTKYEQMKTSMKKIMPVVHYKSIGVLVNHLESVTFFSSKNQMTAVSLSKVWYPNLFANAPNPERDGPDLIQLFITKADFLFDS